MVKDKSNIFHNMKGIVLRIKIRTNTKQQLSCIKIYSCCGKRSNERTCGHTIGEHKAVEAQARMD